MDSSASLDWSISCLEADGSGVEADEPGKTVDEAGEEGDEAGEEVDNSGEGARVVDEFLRSCPGLVIVLSVLELMTGSDKMNLFFLVGLEGESSRFFIHTVYPSNIFSSLAPMQISREDGKIRYAVT